jgi:hypothetical protein
MRIMIPVLQRVQDNAINLKINKEIRIFTVYIWWTSEYPVIVRSLGRGVWNKELRGLLVFPYCLILSRSVGPRSIPELHNSPQDSSPSAFPGPMSEVGEGSWLL